MYEKVKKGGGRAETCQIEVDDYVWKSKKCREREEMCEIKLDGRDSKNREKDRRWREQEDTDIDRRILEMIRVQKRGNRTRRERGRRKRRQEQRERWEIGRIRRDGIKQELWKRRTYCKERQEIVHGERGEGEKRRQEKREKYAMSRTKRDSNRQARRKIRVYCKKNGNSGTERGDDAKTRP